MKKLYGNKKGKVHPSSQPSIADRLSLLPAAILALTAALSPGDKEVLAYLISCSGTNTNFSGHRAATAGCGDHPTRFDCNCFRCYMSYWVRWDESPNRQLIHEILDAYEDGLFRQKKNKGKVSDKREKRNKRVCDVAAAEEEQGRNSGEWEQVEPSRGGESAVDDEEEGKSSVTKLVRFIGERIWGVWGV